MNLEQLKKQFIMDEDALKARLEPVVSKALDHCRVDNHGKVLITNTNLSGKDRVRLTLVARAIAAQLEPEIPGEVSVSEIAQYAGLPVNQVRARGKDAIGDKFAESPKAGFYRVVPHKIEGFLDSISSASRPKK